MSLIASVTFAVTPIGAHARVVAFKSASLTPSTTQAGGHPDWQVEVAFEEPTPFTSPPFIAPKWIFFEAFPGWFNPWNVTRCSAANFASAECPPASQVGLMTLEGSHEGSQQTLGTVPLYSLVASEAFGELGFWVPVLDVPVASSFGPRLADTRLTWVLGPLPEEAAITTVKAEIWGIPADSAHDPSRFPKGSPGAPAGCPGIVGTSCTAGTASGDPQAPFTINPTSCTNGHETYLKAWSVPQEMPGSEFHVTSPQRTGCDQLSFEPTVEIGPTTTAANELSGLDLNLTVPQTISPTAPSPAELISAEFQLPEEFELAAEPPPGLASCSEEEAGFFTEEEEACPPASLVGTAEMDLSITPGPLAGNIYLGTPGPNGAVRLFFFPSGYGLSQKRVLTLKEDEVTGKLIASFVQPEMPIESTELHVFGGEDGLFLTPIYCGDYTVPTTVEAWPGRKQHPTASFSINKGPFGAPCLGPPKKVVVELEPATIPADGHSHSTAYVAVLDNHGTPIPGQFLKFSSSDPGQHIGPVSEYEGGIYEARLIASSTPGITTITATDLSAEPKLSGSAQLDELDTRSPEFQSGLKPPEPGPPSGPRPPTTEIGKARIKHRSAKFTFHGAGEGIPLHFECKLDRKPFVSCTSPKTYKHLHPGRHWFQVRAVDSKGVADTTPAVRSFRIPKPPKG